MLNQANPVVQHHIPLYLVLEQRRVCSNVDAQSFHQVNDVFQAGLQRSRGEEDRGLGALADEPRQRMGEGLRIAQVVGFVKDDEVPTRWTFRPA